LFKVEVFIKSTLGVFFFFRNILDRALAVSKRSVPKSDEWSECLEIKKLCLKTCFRMINTTSLLYFLT
jgi:hypothetical protein